MRKRTLTFAISCMLVIPSLCTAQSSPDCVLKAEQRRAEKIKYAQNMQRKNPEHFNRPKNKKRHRAEIESRVRTMKIWKLTEELQLREEQATRFFPLMNEFEKNLEEIEESRRETLQRIGDLVWMPDVDDKEINKLLDQLEEYDVEQLELRKKFRNDAAEVLEPSQMGKLALFNQRFPVIVREMIREFEDRERPGPGPPPDRRGW